MLVPLELDAVLPPRRFQDALSLGNHFLADPVTRDDCDLASGQGGASLRGILCLPRLGGKTESRGSVREARERRESRYADRLRGACAREPFRCAFDCFEERLDAGELVDD
jgi:hypothetical protein